MRQMYYNGYDPGSKVENPILELNYCYKEDQNNDLKHFTPQSHRDMIIVHNNQFFSMCSIIYNDLQFCNKLKQRSWILQGGLASLVTPFHYSL